jgi:hypothetical protein
LNVQYLKEIDNGITKQLDELKNIITNFKPKEICQFNLSQDETILRNEFSQLNYSGIYLIEIENNKKFKNFNSWIEDFKKEWENENCKFTPSLKNKRIKKYLDIEDLQDWIPIYLGKSKKIKTRIEEHIFHELDNSTFGLKLCARANFKENRFRLSAIEIKVTNYDAIIPVIESGVRDIFNPIIGGQ